jgi:hypothetical protein
MYILKSRKLTKKALKPTKLLVQLAKGNRNDLKNHRGPA